MPPPPWAPLNRLVPVLHPADARAHGQLAHAFGTGEQLFMPRPRLPIQLRRRVRT